MIEDEAKRLEYNAKVREYYYKNKEKVNTRHLLKYYSKKALDAGIDITGLSMNDIKYKILENKLNKMKS
jgi:hypothetical protein